MGYEKNYNNHGGNNRNNGGKNYGDRNRSKGGNRGNFSNSKQQPYAGPIKSPYNFVPLSPIVIFPDQKEWAEVSHDIPFEDGISGKIDLTVTLQSDTYIRNSKDGETSFFKALIDGKEKFVIPGTSFKGMIRNVLEIASLGKMQNVNDVRYSVRDLQRDFYTKKLTAKENGVIYPKTKAGWLCLGDGCYGEDGEKKWQIIPCDYARIEQDLLEKEFGRHNSKSYKESAKDKYSNFKKKLFAWFNLKKEENHRHSCGTINYKKVDKISWETPLYKSGTLVFTGQPSNRITQEERDNDEKFKRQHPKHMEFIFYDEKPSKTLEVSWDHKEDFIFVNSDNNKKALLEWEYWKAKLENGERVPVFYLGDDKEVHSFGLAMMYRLPYDYSIGDTIKNTSADHSDKSRHDMAELIFGYVNGNDALRGRVQFSHFISDDAVEGNTLTTILGSPKPTYYPNYLEQPDEKSLSNKIVKYDGKTIFKDPNYKTFMDQDARIRGWKRYPSENVLADYNANGAKEGDKSSTDFTPLQKGATFEGHVRFFNLRPVELGALLWALDFGGNKNCQHKIGMGKPLGFGRISVALTGVSNLMRGNDSELKSETVAKDAVSSFCEEYCSLFKKYMNDEILKWKEKHPDAKLPEMNWERQINELIVMADVTKYLPEEYRGYPSLKNQDGRNEFVDCKGKNSPKRLEPYSKNAKEVK
ncbi:TIGR03986 family CRISPR-associated RAMP protein [bacterium]|nr:TIGR03986 family CRISPR-associated RAMP protein [bacterium]MBP5435427.1 TIGR03986 family CRISPR-associated RAMP protein [bacterium]